MGYIGDRLRTITLPATAMMAGFMAALPIGGFAEWLAAKPSAGEREWTFAHMACVTLAVVVPNALILVVVRRIARQGDRGWKERSRGFWFAALGAGWLLGFIPGVLLMLDVALN